MTGTAQTDLDDHFSATKHATSQFGHHLGAENKYVSVPNQEIDDIEFDTSQTTATDQLVPVSLLRIYILSIASFAIGSAWAFNGALHACREFAVVTPYFEKGLMAGSVLSHAVWVVGPLSGLIVAPLVGALSDRCTTRYGRRKPFIFGGMVATVSSMLGFSNSTRIASLFAVSGTEAHRISAIVIAVISFCVLDLAINTTMWPVRALQADLVPVSQQHYVQSASIVMSSLGDLSVNAVLHMFEEPIAQIRVIFIFAAIFYALTISTLLCAEREKSVAANDPAIANSAPLSLNLFSYFRGLPPSLWRIGGTYALGFFTFFCFQPNASSWIGSSVLNGNPNAKEGTKEAYLFERGVNLYGRSGVIRALLQIVFSAIYPKLLQIGAPPGQLLASTFLSFSLIIFIYAETKSEVIAQFGVILFSLPSAALLTLPVGLTVALSDETNRGRHLGALNVFAVIPQLIDTCYTGFVSKTFGESGIVRIGAMWGMLTALSALIFSKNDNLPESEDI